MFYHTFFRAKFERKAEFDKILLPAIALNRLATQYRIIKNLVSPITDDYSHKGRFDNLGTITKRFLVKLQAEIVENCMVLSYSERMLDQPQEMLPVIQTHLSVPA